LSIGALLPSILRRLWNSYLYKISASYAGLENWKSAVDDAKECIRLEPKFIKGYYRLASAQMSLKEYDTAIRTIRQGLIIEPNNSQLMKQLRLAQQQKKVDAAKQQSAMVATSAQQGTLLPSTSDGIALDPVTAAEYQDLQKQYTQLSRDFNIIQADILKSQRESKVADITCKELSADFSDNSSKACYRSVGKLFVKTTANDMIKSLKQRQTTEDENVTKHTQKIQYMERQLTSLQQNMNEIIQKAQ
jgi:chaperonin cofactor prefoldin